LITSFKEGLDEVEEELEEDVDEVEDDDDEAVDLLSPLVVVEDEAIAEEEGSYTEL